MTKKQKPDGYIFGRPTKYKPEFCQIVIDVMSKGGSKTEVCAALSIHYQTFLDWQTEGNPMYNPYFSDAVKGGETLSQAWWEGAGRKGIMGEMEFNATLYQFNMKNRFKEDWRDKQEIVQTTTIVDMTDEDLDKQIREMGGSDE